MLILFVCTGNYYRSRFSEIIFNTIAKEKGLPARAISRGFRLNPEKNKGVLSPHTTRYLTQLGLLPADPGVPTVLTLNDLEAADRIILLDEKEHRPMIQQRFPDWENKVEYWSFEDDYLVNPDTVLPSLRSKVESMFSALEINGSPSKTSSIQSQQKGA